MNKFTMKLVAPACLVLCACLQTSCVWTESIHGSGQVIREDRSVSQFDRVSVSGSGQLTIIQGDEESLVIEADDNLLPYIKSEVENGWLHLGPHNVSLRPTKTIRYQLKLKNLRELSLSGSLAAQADRLKTEDLTVRISGSGKIQLPQLESANLSLHVSGSGEGLLGGRVREQELRISGSGGYRAGELVSDHADIHISGSGEATVWVRESLEVSVSGSGHVKYFGQPKVSQHISGSGKVQGLGAKDIITIEQ